MNDPLPKPGMVLCRLDDIADPGGHGIEFREGDRIYRIVVVRRGDQVWGYQNRCPHARTPLDWITDRFLTKDDKHLLCATHGARFTIESGACIKGPCVGQSLNPWPVTLEDGVIIAQATVHDLI